MQIARNFALYGRFDPDTQYNPLYPLLIAPAFHLFGMEGVYLWARLLSAISFALAAVPVYFFAKELDFPKNGCRIIAILSVLLPSGVFTHIIWGDPLMFPLIAAGVLFTLKYFKTAHLVFALVAGMFFGLSYVAKQYGLGLGIAATLSALLWGIVSYKTHKHRVWGAFAYLLGIAIFISPLVIRNALKPEGNVVGYQSHFDEYSKTITEKPFLEFIGTFADALSYQVSGLIFSTWGLLPIVAVFFIVYWKKIKSHEFWLFWVLLFSLGGLVLLSSVHMISYKLPHLANGRYYATVTPFVIILGLRWLYTVFARKKNTEKINNTAQTNATREPFKFLLIKLILPSFLIIVFFLISHTPLHGLIPLGLVHNPELSFMNYFLHNDNIPWTHGIGRAPATMEWIIAIALLPVFTLCLFIAGYRYKSRILFLLPIMFVLYQSYDAHRYGRKLGDVHFHQNNILRYVTTLKEDKISFGFDKESFDASAMFFAQFWLGPSQYPYYDPVAFMGTAKFTFSPSAVLPNIPQIIYDRGTAVRGPSAEELIKFGSTEGVVLLPCHHKTPAFPDGYYQIAGHTPMSLRGKTGHAIKKISVTVPASTSCDSKIAEFDVRINGKQLFRINAHSLYDVTLETEVDVPAGEYEIQVIPVEGKIWALKGVSFESTHNNRPGIMVSAKPLPFPILKESWKWKIYDSH
ncbi:hypothetical protein GCM10011332_20910 [Terasakiella brassicae]|uniref:Glycosyltransferase RgtA/B/C/D-like domain-containing protein n=2 Tax=Terasakiella brassicae TaxID=1634917 RepID=A0A917FB57_9PROT|nr:hypothetical protein GCM10011332_20910 [Terasakiella brassicae]